MSNLRFKVENKEQTRDLFRELIDEVALLSDMMYIKKTLSDQEVKEWVTKLREVTTQFKELESIKLKLAEGGKQ